MSSSHDSLSPAPEAVDRQVWLDECQKLLVREKAHTREGDAIAAARRRLPMTEINPVTLVGADGPTSLRDIFQGRDQLVVYKHMWHLGKPFEDQCEGCTATVWDFHDASYLEARGVSAAVFGEGPFPEMAPFREFMGYTLPWFSTYGIDDPVYAGGGGSIACYLRRGDRFFLTYETSDRGVEAIMASHRLLDLTVFGRQESWEDSPEGWPQVPTYTKWRVDGRPVAQWTRPGATPVKAVQHTHCSGQAG